LKAFRSSLEVSNRSSDFNSESLAVLRAEVLDVVACEALRVSLLTEDSHATTAFLLLDLLDVDFFVAPVFPPLKDDLPAPLLVLLFNGSSAGLSCLEEPEEDCDACGQDLPTSVRVSLPDLPARLPANFSSPGRSFFSASASSLPITFSADFSSEAIRFASILVRETGFTERPHCMKTPVLPNLRLQDEQSSLLSGMIRDLAVLAGGSPGADPELAASWP